MGAVMCVTRVRRRAGKTRKAMWREQAIPRPVPVDRELVRRLAETAKRDIEAHRDEIKAEVAAA